MKRSYADSLRSSSAMSDPTGPLSPDERRLARAEALLREGNRDRIRENELAKARREAIMVKAAREEARRQGAEHSIHNVLVKEENGELKFETIIYKEASKEIVDLMDNPQSLLTGLVWSGLKSADRIAMLQALNLPPDQAFAESVLDVLPEKSKEYILGWQKQINNAGAWTGSLSVGSAAEELIERGYVLLGKEPSTGQFHDVSGREQRQGLAGSTSYMRAIMGETYLTWLLANEEHPIEV